MKFCFIVLFAGLAYVSTANAKTWNATCSKWHYNVDVTKNPHPVYATSLEAPGTCSRFNDVGHGFAGCNPAPDTWQEVDLTQFQVAPSAIEADLVGQLIITLGTVAGTPLLGIKFRAAGTAASTEFQGYTIAQSGPATLGTNGQLNAGFVGARIPFSTRVPIINGKIEYSWSYKTTSATVTTEAYMVDLALVGWCD
ncbi:MAG: hypothetical protein KIT82_10220 [Bradyrhizobium sp.]|nr:hypothetical protein [Bradyrhizobium sp.]